jgi:type IV secretory pathway protease TraF
MKIDLNFNLVDLDGKAIENANAGKLVANSLVQQSKGDALKFWEWALALNKGEILDLDSSDQDTFKNFVKDNENFAIIAKAQILHKLKKD